MKINRATVKQQAQDIIKGNVFKLFLISLIVGILAGGGTSYNFKSSDMSDIEKYFNGEKNPFSDNYEKDENSDEFDFGEFTTQYDENYFNEFDGNGKVSLNTALMGMSGVFAGAMALVGLLFVAKNLFLGPLNVMLDGLFWQLIRGNNMELGDGLNFVFKKTFDKNYWNKFLFNLLKSLLIGLLYLLLIIPGVIYTYKWYFASYIMAEKPELSAEEALKLSDKMTKGHKWELFVMDLSFILWYLLIFPTFGLIMIYVGPYVHTTQALYYENFKIRAFNEGAITQYDFIPAKERVQQYAAAQPNNQYYAPAPQQNEYYTPVQQENTYYAPAQPMPQENNYYQPAAPAQPVQENTYYQPVQTVEPVQPVQPEPQTFEPAAPAAEETPAPTEYYTPTEPEQSDNN